MQVFKLQSPVAVMAAVLSIALFTGCKAQGQAQASAAAPLPQVEIASIRSQEVMLWSSFTGRVVAPETVEIRPRVSGYIEEIRFQEGQLVQQGEVLLVIDKSPYAAREQLSKAELDRAQSEMRLAQSEADRATKLRQSRAISDEEFERRSAALSAATAARDAAAASLQSARLNLEYTEIKSPISGRIGRALLTRGNLANADVSLLTTVVSVDPVHVYFESDQQTAQANPHASGGGIPVRVTLQGHDNTAVSGELDFIDNRYDRDTGTLQYRARVANADSRLRPGQFVRVEMPISAARQSLLIDEKAVLTDQDKRYVYVLDESDHAIRRFIETGRRFDGLLVVEQGLQSGDRVVVNGLQKIPLPGMQVAPTVVAMRRGDFPALLANGGAD